MSSGDFDFFKRIGNERIERDPFGNTLKKYGGTGTSWPTHSVVQPFGQTHQQQQQGIAGLQNNINDFFKKNF